ncbi:hypothetical protein F9278_13420 [Streptomyces phaeolivaceus]|uniref:Sortase n=1 Tax=Streptomyces phaeolivaceus TaxID=2653200 RepID=A0A5P8K1C0_9ACTN|nr:hypothetical protein [Streptomyces phaeolivaceus]QFQ97045.1 hypothetical protein F9278_13420 [Streptomyces phaeolivaceus]
MRRTVRPLTATALALTLAAFAAAPAYGGAGTGRLELSPTGVVPGDEVAVHTAACGAKGTAAGDASAVGAGSFSLAPDDGEGRLDGRFEVPPSAQPGTYEIVAICANGGRRVTGDLVVSLTGTRTGPPAYPRGSVKTGVGGALGPDPVQTAAGVAALAVAAAGGTWLLHRRARGDGI